jgi:hypothetical protein
MNRVLCLALALNAVAAGCSNPLGPGSQRVFFRNHTSVAYHVISQTERFSVESNASSQPAPLTVVETQVLPGMSADVSLVSLEGGDQLTLLVVPVNGEPADTVVVQMVLDDEGDVDRLTVVALEDTLVDTQAVRGVAGRLIVEAREVQKEALRVFVENQTEDSLSVRVEERSVKIAPGLFPVSSLLAPDPAASIQIEIAGQPVEDCWCVRERDILYQVWQVSELQTIQRFDIPPNRRTDQVEVAYRIVAE